MDDDGFILFESSAISKYLADKHDSKYYPKELRRRALLDQWIDFCNIHVHNSLVRVFFNKVIAPAQGFDVDERSSEFGEKMLASYFPVLDAELGKNEYLAGNKMTIADINLLSILEPAEISGIDLSKYENLYKYTTGLRKQDFYTKCHSDYRDVLAKIM
ncbi:MAG TPA: glutathione S-transferase family protein [Thermodesulfobacteriota bacterium]|nr:glutathione S-transferase family protein [Thermodesulfobacteriota bacterium]